MTNNSMFGPMIRAKVAWWKTEIAARRAAYRLAHHKHVVMIFYALGILMGWLLCSEWQVYLKTGEITTFPWE